MFSLVRCDSLLLTFLTSIAFAGVTVCRRNFTMVGRSSSDADGSDCTTVCCTCQQTTENVTMSSSDVCTTVCCTCQQTTENVTMISSIDVCTTVCCTCQQTTENVTMISSIDVCTTVCCTCQQTTENVTMMSSSDVCTTVCCTCQQTTDDMEMNRSRAAHVAYTESKTGKLYSCCRDSLALEFIYTKLTLNSNSAVGTLLIGRNWPGSRCTNGRIGPT